MSAYGKNNCYSAVLGAATIQFYYWEFLPKNLIITTAIVVANRGILDSHQDPSIFYF